jgi:hypothetical protein
VLILHCTCRLLIHISPRFGSKDPTNRGGIWEPAIWMSINKNTKYAPCHLTHVPRSTSARALHTAHVFLQGLFVISSRPRFRSSWRWRRDRNPQVAASQMVRMFRCFLPLSSLFNACLVSVSARLWQLTKIPPFKFPGSDERQKCVN